MSQQDEEKDLSQEDFEVLYSGKNSLFQERLKGQTTQELPSPKGSELKIIPAKRTSSLNSTPSGGSQGYEKIPTSDLQTSSSGSSVKADIDSKALADATHNSSDDDDDEEVNRTLDSCFEKPPQCS